MSLHELLDFEYGPDGDHQLAAALRNGADPNDRDDSGEPPLLVAARRRRLEAVRILLECGADINATNAHGKSAYAHAARRQFDEITELLVERGARTTMSAADEFAAAVGTGDLGAARTMIEADPTVVRTGNPEEDRLLADIAGRGSSLDAVRLLVDAGADLTARGLDDGTPLHIAAWFGQPRNAAVLVDAGAPLERFDSVHESSPLGWAVHGSRYSGAADERTDAYDAVVRLLLEAGARTCYPDDKSDAYFKRLLGDASPSVEAILLGNGHTC